MSPLVVDASVAAAWCFEDRTSAFAEGVLDQIVEHGALAPAVWPFEMANVLALAERLGRLSQTRVTQVVATLEALPISIDEESLAAVLRSVVPIARNYSLSAYDAAYLELAIRRDLPLATLDDALRAAATRAGVQLVD